MNLQFVLINDDAETVSCIISKDADRKSEWEKVFSIQKGYGLCAEYDETCVKIVDYFHAETRAQFEIVSQQETEQKVSYQLTKI